MAEAAAHAVKAAFAALMAGGGAVFVVLILIVGLIGGAAFLGNSQSSEVLSAEVLAHTPAIQKYASEFGIPEYVSAIQAIMMQESGGREQIPCRLVSVLITPSIQIHPERFRMQTIPSRWGYSIMRIVSEKLGVKVHRIWTS